MHKLQYSYSYSLAKAWNLDIFSSNDIIEASNGEKTNVIGRTKEIRVVFEGLEANVKFIVTNIKAVDVLLGIDWFKQTGVILDPKNESFIIPQRIINTKGNTNEEHYELAHHLNMLTIEHDEMEFIDDYACFESDKVEHENIKIDSTISKNINLQLKTLLKEYESSFAISADQLGCCKDVSYNAI